ncbi:invasion associated locus B family protein [Litoreibacter roseus]|uniref:Invasion-associated locus B family protein n=1 Tax=Litoreibacter roseus TaxID=2601869 RepID=A0A6N6JL17_9RHOB|nr:invasion associated locus B family protein [Litoreibacter roseus]GFE66834.1 invasion-associated locus B family protein [Litoreibacter roseus]
MSDLLKSVLIVAAMMAAAPAFSQDTTETPTEETPAEEAPTPETSETEAPGASDGAAPAETTERADGLSTGSAEIEVGQTYRLSTHGDWELRCIRAPEGQQEPCQLYQLLEDQNGNSVAEINLFALPPEDTLVAGATIVTPLQTLLTQQVRLSVDGSQAKVYPFTFCTEIGCFARVGFTDADIATFKRGREGKITVVPAQAPDQRVELTVSLSGFTAGFEAVTKALEN